MKLGINFEFTCVLSNSNDFDKMRVKLFPNFTRHHLITHILLYHDRENETITGKVLFSLRDKHKNKQNKLFVIFVLALMLMSRENALL